jgi:hypothetical protein
MVLTLDQQGCGIWIWSQGTFPLIGNPLKLSVGGAEPLDSSPMCSEPQEWSPALRGGKGRNGDKRSRWVRRPFTPNPQPTARTTYTDGRTADRYWKHEPRLRRFGASRCFEAYEQTWYHYRLHGKARFTIWLIRHRSSRCKHLTFFRYFGSLIPLLAINTQDVQTENILNWLW